MAAIAQSLPHLNTPAAWLWQFLKDELAPYRGRTTLVARMVITSTLVMILSMTFKLPFGAYGAIFGLVLSHDNLEATAANVRGFAVGFLAAGAYIILGLTIALADPGLRFIWITGGFLLAFWAMSALSRYSASSRAGYLMAITVTLWDAHISPELKFERTLWAMGVITMAAVMSLAIQMVFAAFQKSDELIEAIAERLSCVEGLLRHYRDGDPVTASIRTDLARLVMTGTSRMRQLLHRGGFDPQYPEQMGAVVALTGRLVDLAANLPEFTAGVPESERVGRLASHIKKIREDLTRGSVPRRLEPASDTEIPSGLPLLGEMEQTVSLIYDAFTGSQALSVFAPTPRAAGVPRSFMMADLLNVRHFKFALRGCLAATACYVAFNALDWPQISTSVTTCFLTALTTIGASRQKQFLRFTGALIGCLGIGMASQIFLLPSIDSIAGFTALFIPVIAAAAWVATSSPRLAYLGVQVAVGFCLINLQEFSFNTSLTVARDRAVGIFLGLLMMWVFFDRLWSTPAGVLMRTEFISTLRLLALLAREPVSNDVQVAIERSHALRERISSQLDRVRTLTDAVLFEFGVSRRRDLAFRDRVRQWGPQLRTLAIIRIAALKYELQVPGFDVPDAVRLRQWAYDEFSAGMLDDVADRLEGREPSGTPEKDELQKSSAEALDNLEAEASRELPTAKAQSLITLIRAIDDLTTRVRKQMAADFAGVV